MKGPTFEHRNGMEIATFADAAEWETWLAAHGAERGEVWLRIARRDSGHTTVTADQALDVCLCYGWIDSLRRGDERATFSSGTHRAAQAARGQRSTLPRSRFCSRLVGCSRQAWPRLLPQKRPGVGQPTWAERCRAERVVA